jgi:RNA polymerase subunit RPABC4/transcription elongation factor Spt4
LGIIIGLICGLLTDIVGGGYIATILNMDENLEIIAVNILKTGSSLPTKKCPRCNKDVAVDYTGCPHCGNSFVESNTSILQGSSTTTENTKKCKHCSIRVSADKTVCPKCGGTDFIYS